MKNTFLLKKTRALSGLITLFIICLLISCKKDTKVSNETTVAPSLKSEKDGLNIRITDSTISINDHNLFFEDSLWVWEKPIGKYDRKSNEVGIGVAYIWDSLGIQLTTADEGYKTGWSRELIRELYIHFLGLDSPEAKTGELTAAIKSGLRKSADDLLKYEDEIIERATREGVEDVDGLLEEMKRIGGNNYGDSIIVSKDPIKVEQFVKELERLKSLNIKPEEALNYIEEAMPYFNHKVIDNEIIQVDFRNCGNTVEVINDFLRTGEIKVADPSGMQSLNNVAAKFGGGYFQPVKNILRMKELMSDGEKVIVYGFKKVSDVKFEGHYFYGIKRNKELHFYDGQTGEFVIFGNTEISNNFIKRGYDGFRYLTVRN